MPNRVLLLAAGFSKNWNGWLANEIDDYLIGHKDVDSYAKNLLMRSGSKGFEDVLDTLQAQQSGSLKGFEAGVMNAFNAMNTAYAQRPDFEFCNESEYSVRKFLTRFDAIFTLNQDALVEMHYLDASPYLLSDGRLDGCAIFGLHADPMGHALDKVRIMRPDRELPTLSPRIQPYIKLHGSSNWRSDTGNLLIVGGNKTSAIAGHPLLKWGLQTFEDYLSKPDTRLMVIGYGFRDHHINSAILRATAGSALKVFIVDLQGIEAMNWETAGGQIPARSDLFQAFQPHVGGVSRRPLTLTFGGSDGAEHAKLMEFLK